MQQREVIKQRLTNYRNNQHYHSTSDQSHRPTDREGYRIGSSATANVDKRRFRAKTLGPRVLIALCVYTLKGKTSAYPGHYHPVRDGAKCSTSREPLSCVCVYTVCMEGSLLLSWSIESCWCHGWNRRRQEKDEIESLSLKPK